jgi:hypothetical protein
MSRRFWLHGLLYLVLSLIASLSGQPAGATTILPMTMEDTVREAEAIFVGRVVRHWSRWTDESRQQMATDYLLEVEDTILSSGGIETGRPVVLTYWGGTIGNETQEVAGLELPADGQRYVIMLRTGYQTLGLSPLVGANQGMFLIEPESPFLVPVVKQHDGELLWRTKEGRIIRGADSNSPSLRHRVDSAGIADSFLARPGVLPSEFTYWLRGNLAPIKAQKPTPSRSAAGKSGLDREAPFSGDQNGLENSQRPLTGHPGASSFRQPGHKRLSGRASRGAADKS